MAAVSIKELNVHTSEILRWVRDQREPTDVTLRGRVVARLVPVERPQPTPDEPEAIWRRRDEVTAEVSKEWPAGLSAVNAIREDRREL